MDNPSITFESLIDEQERLFVAMESLNRVAQAAMESVDSGGLIGQAYPYLRTVVDDAATLAGVRQRAVPSLESFGGKHTRVTSTLVSIEGIKEVMKKIWEMVVETFKKITKWLKQYWTKFKMSRTASGQHLRYMRKRIAGAGKLNDVSARPYRTRSFKLVTLDLASLKHAVDEMIGVLKESAQFEKSREEGVRDVVVALTASLENGDINSLKRALAGRGFHHPLPTSFQKVPGSDSETGNLKSQTFTTKERIKFSRNHLDVSVYTTEWGNQFINSTVWFNADENFPTELPVWSKADLERICDLAEDLLQEEMHFIAVCMERVKILIDHGVDLLSLPDLNQNSDLYEGLEGDTVSSRRVINAALKQLGDRGLLTHAVSYHMFDELLKLVERGLERYV